MSTARSAAVCPESPTPSRDLRAQRRVALLQTGVALALFVALAGVLVPWGAGGFGAEVAPGDLFTSSHLTAAESYAREARAWSWASLTVSLAFAATVGFTPVGRAAVSRLPGPWWLQTVLAVVAFVTTQELLTAGFRVGVWRLRHQVGLSTQSWDGFLRDTTVRWVVEAVALAALLLVLVGLARRFARSWTVVAGALAASLVVVVSYVYPVVVEPLFNDFTPLPAGELRDRITQVAAEEGVSVDDVVVADASRRTTTLNAWVSGFGETRRVVLHDNLVEEVAPDEVLVIVAHELAHARNHDVVVGTALGAVGALAAVGLLGLLVGRRASVSAGDPRVVPLVLACLAFGTQMVAPVENAISRSLERRADVEALCLTGNADAFEAIQVRLAVRSLGDPTPPVWSQRWWGSHPPVMERVSLARSRITTAGRVCADEPVNNRSGSRPRT